MIKPELLVKESLSQPIDFSEIRAILKCEPRERLSRQLVTLTNYFRNNNFIKNEISRNSKDPEVIQNLFRNMLLEEFPKKHTVFNYGDRGQLFYIVI
jgi:hypothetical protein